MLVIMSVSRRHLHPHPGFRFDPEALGRMLRDRFPEIDFAMLLGSARDGRVPPDGDIDLAVCTAGRLKLDLRMRIAEAVRELAPEATADVGQFNGAEPVYRFEALKGRLLFARDMDRFAAAFSLACREYEIQMRHYRRQFEYRLKRREIAA